MCSFYFYYTHFFSGLSRGRPAFFFGFAVLTIFGRVCYNKALGHTEKRWTVLFPAPTYLHTMGGDAMEHYVTWSELFAFLTFLVTFTTLLYHIFHDNHKEITAPLAIAAVISFNRFPLMWGATVCRYALSIFIIRIFFSPVCQGADRRFFGFAVLTIFGRVCYNHKQSALERVHILYSAVELLPRKGVIAMTWMEFLTLCNVVCDIILILRNKRT